MPTSAMDHVQQIRGGGHRAPPLVLSLALLSLALLSLGGGRSPLSGQTVRGETVDQTTLAPVEGALALLIDANGQEIDGALSNAAGRFILRGKIPGQYTVRAERIGYRTTTTDPFTLESSQLFGIRMEMGETAIQLEELLIEGEQRCVVRPEEGLQVARVWEEARKALTVQDWTDREGLYRFQMFGYQRDLDPGALRVRAETRHVTTGVARSPIQSLPAEDLMANGFIRHQEDGSLKYFGPDAPVLLSDIFLDTHCFRLTEDSDQPSAVGLAFEPVRRGEIKDVLGTLWLDRETGNLEFLEYRYTWAQYPEAQGVARGRVEFEGLPNGSWIVRNWWIRMPMLAQDITAATGGRTGVYVSGIREVGGGITEISALDRHVLAQAEGGMVSGLVWDSTRYRPLEGARIYLSGTSYSAITDAQGRFLLEGLSEGVFTAAFTHPRLDTLGVRSKGVEVEITPGELTEVLLGVPSEGSILEDACRDQERPLGSAVVSGVVRAAEDGRPMPQAMVRLEWQEVNRLGRDRLSGQNKWFETPTDAKGRFTVCSVPSEELIVIRATFMDHESDTVSISVLEGTYTVVDLKIQVSPKSTEPLLHTVLNSTGDPPPSYSFIPTGGPRTSCRMIAFWSSLTEPSPNNS